MCGGIAGKLGNPYLTRYQHCTYQQDQDCIGWTMGVRGYLSRHWGEAVAAHSHFQNEKPAIKAMRHWEYIGASDYISVVGVCFRDVGGLEQKATWLKLCRLLKNERCSYWCRDSKTLWQGWLIHCRRQVAFWLTIGSLAEEATKVTEKVAGFDADTCRKVDKHGYTRTTTDDSLLPVTGNWAESAGGGCRDEGIKILSATF